MPEVQVLSGGTHRVVALLLVMVLEVTLLKLQVLTYVLCSRAALASLSDLTSHQGSADHRLATAALVTKSLTFVSEVSTRGT